MSDGGCSSANHKCSNPNRKSDTAQGRDRHDRGQDGRPNALLSSLLSSLELSDTSIYEPQIRALLGTAPCFYSVVFLTLKRKPNTAQGRNRHDRGQNGRLCACARARERERERAREGQNDHSRDASLHPHSGLQGYQRYPEVLVMSEVLVAHKKSHDVLVGTCYG